MASKAISESSVNNLSTRAGGIVKNLYEYLDGHSTGPGSHGRRELSIIVDEMGQYTNVSVKPCKWTNAHERLMEG
jgi:hypothetical protein